MKQEYEGHGEVEQGIESHLLGCNTQRHQTSFLKLFPHVNNKIRVMFRTSFSFQHLSYSNFHLVQTNFINIMFLAVFLIERYNNLSSSSFKNYLLISLTTY